VRPAATRKSANETVVRITTVKENLNSSFWSDPFLVTHVPCIANGRKQHKMAV
jgi:hypothetical protein